MKNLFIKILILVPLIGISQVKQLKVSVKYLNRGVREYSNVDTCYFEVYWNCGMDNGIRLKENLPNGEYQVFYNDTLKYSVKYLDTKPIQYYSFDDKRNIINN